MRVEASPRACIILIAPLGGGNWQKILAALKGLPFGSGGLSLLCSPAQDLGREQLGAAALSAQEGRMSCSEGTEQEAPALPPMLHQRTSPCCPRC